MVAYQTGYLEQYGARPKVSIDSTKTGFDEKDEKDIQDVSSRDEEINKLTPHVDLPEQKAATNIDLPPEPEISSETQGENQSYVEDKLNEIIEESTTSVPEKALPEYSQNNLSSADHSADTDASAEGNLRKVESETVTAPEKEIQDIPLDTRSSASLGEEETKTVPSPTTAVKLQVPFFMHPVLVLILIDSSYRFYEILKNDLSIYMRIPSLWCNAYASQYYNIKE